jgi:F-type H+-transporting ATPase subunit epsilon
MADKLNFSLVSPERELFSGQVDQVDIPGTEGDFGVFPDHSPMMAAIRTGAITVTNESKKTQFFIQGGFADVTPEGLTILAEKALPMDEVNSALIKEMMEDIEKTLAKQEGETALAAQQDIDSLKRMSNSFEDFYHS